MWYFRAAAQESTNGATEGVPEPVVKIDNQSDPFATIVSLEYGNLLGELADTVCLIALAPSTRPCVAISDSDVCTVADKCLEDTWVEYSPRQTENKEWHGDQ